MDARGNAELAVLDEQVQREDAVGEMLQGIASRLGIQQRGAVVAAVGTPVLHQVCRSLGRILGDLLRQGAAREAPL